jgi:hypothetical protein
MLNKLDEMKRKSFEREIEDPSKEMMKQID